MLLAHFMRAAASRTFWTAGRSRPMRMAIMAITTSNSISVKPRRFFNRDSILHSFGTRMIGQRTARLTHPARPETLERDNLCRSRQQMKQQVSRQTLSHDLDVLGERTLGTTMGAML